MNAAVPIWWERRARAWRRLAFAAQEAAMVISASPPRSSAEGLIELRAAAKGAKDIAYPVEGESASFWAGALMGGARVFAEAPAELQELTAPALGGVATFTLNQLVAEHDAMCRRFAQRRSGERDDD